jgi:hypothetical protein
MSPPGAAAKSAKKGWSHGHGPAFSITLLSCKVKQENLSNALVNEWFDRV